MHAKLIQKNEYKDTRGQKTHLIIYMYELNLPKYELKIRREAGRITIFDNLRRKYVALTPEEWVRQHFVHYMTEHKGYPTSHFANEIQMTVGSKRLRCDSVFYGIDLKPQIIIEYKAPNVAITQKVFDQISVYNMLLHVDYLIVSNGLQHYCCRMDYEHHQYLFLKEIPDFSELTL